MKLFSSTPKIKFVEISRVTLWKFDSNYYNVVNIRVGYFWIWLQIFGNQELSLMRDSISTSDYKYTIESIGIQQSRKSVAWFLIMTTKYTFPHGRQLQVMKRQTMLSICLHFTTIYLRLNMFYNIYCYCISTYYYISNLLFSGMRGKDL